jgi:hypothetical protein
LREEKCCKMSEGDKTQSFGSCGGMKIFVSSTYLDLREYRVEVRKAIEERGNEFVGMEIFHSHTHEPSEFCPERVEECDAFVLLVAYRYGNIPEGGKISITHLEYEHALRYLFSEDVPPTFLDNLRGAFPL